MKQNHTRPSESSTGPHVYVVWTLVVVVAFACIAAADIAWADDAVTLRIQSEAAYTLGPGDSESLARQLALFRAKVKAAYQAADRFEQQKLIQFVDHDKNELAHLVADRLAVNPDWNECRTNNQTVTCSVRTRTTVRLSDFIEAQLISLDLGKKEARDNYRHEMEPPIPPLLRPGRALAKAYRLIDKNKLRMATIYLNRLEEAYPNWREIYELKAVALRLESRPFGVLVALRKACLLGSRKACAQLK
jgi:hypothetical protein